MQFQGRVQGYIDSRAVSTVQSVQALYTLIDCTSSLVFILWPFPGCTVGAENLACGWEGRVKLSTERIVDHPEYKFLA